MRFHDDEDAVTKVWCGDCCSEGRPNPECLGRLYLSDGVGYFHSEDRRGSELNRRTDGTRGFVLHWMSMPPEQLASPGSKMLIAVCERHGQGELALRDVLNKPANIVLKLKATT